MLLILILLLIVTVNFLLFIQVRKRCSKYTDSSRKYGFRFRIKEYISQLRAAFNEYNNTVHFTLE